MKRFSLKMFSVIILILLIVILTQSNFQPVDTLIRPPKVQGENSKIQSAFESFINEKYTLVSPLSGKYNSAYIFKDVNGDKKDDVIVFYCCESTGDIARMNILFKKDNVWQSVADYESAYNQVHQVNFADIDNDGADEIIIGWGIYDSEVTNSLDVCKVTTLNGEEKITNIFSKNYIEFSVCDVDADKINDILLIEKTSLNNLPEFKASVYSFSKGKKEKMSEILLDPIISSVKNITYDFYSDDNITRLYIDGYKSDSGMTTDMLFWNKDELKRVYLNDKNSVSSLAVRNTNVLCSDTDGDGLIEIPTENIFPESSLISADSASLKEQSYIKWIEYSDDEFSVSENELINSLYGYSIKLSDDFIGKVTVKNDLSTGIITFYELKEIADITTDENEDNELNKPPFTLTRQKNYTVGEPLFEIFALDNHDSEAYESLVYHYLKSNNRFSYYYRIFNKGEQLEISREKLKNIIVN